MTAIKCSCFAIALLLLSSCATRITEPIPAWPEKGYTVARIPTDKYRAGSIVVIDGKAITKVDELRTEGVTVNSRIGKGTVSGNTTQGLNLGLALTLVGAPAGGELDSKFTKHHDYTFEWSGASIDSILLMDDRCKNMLIEWIRKAGETPHPLLDGKQFYLVSESAKAQQVSVTVKGMFDEAYKASLFAVISETIKATPRIGVNSTSSQELVVTNEFENPLTVSYQMIPIRIQRGQQEILKVGDPVKVPFGKYTRQQDGTGYVSSAFSAKKAGDIVFILKKASSALNKLKRDVHNYSNNQTENFRSTIKVAGVTMLEDSFKLRERANQEPLHEALEHIIAGMNRIGTTLIALSHPYEAQKNLLQRAAAEIDTLSKDVILTTSQLESYQVQKKKEANVPWEMLLP